MNLKRRLMTLTAVAMSTVAIVSSPANALAP